MKKKLIVLIGIMTVIVLSSILLSFFTMEKKDDNKKVTIVTSFYPMYILASNIVGNISNVELVNLTEPTSGCLHDYQLTTTDMKKLENADILILNGGGMENFTNNIIDAYPNLPIITASDGIQYLKSEDHEHGEETGVKSGEEIHEENISSSADDSADSIEDGNGSEPHEHGEYNAHVWLNMNYYIKQIQTVQDALAEYDPENAKSYQENGNAYLEEIKKLKNEMETTFQGIKKTRVVIFHDSFAYLAQELGLEVVHAVNMDSESSLSAGEIAEVVDEVTEQQVKILFTEEQFSTSIADNIAKETGAEVYVIDSIVRGDMSKDGYITAMRKNIEVLKQAFMK